MICIVDLTSENKKPPKNISEGFQINLNNYEIKSLIVGTKSEMKISLRMSVTL